MRIRCRFSGQMNFYIRKMLIKGFDLLNCIDSSIWGFYLGVIVLLHLGIINLRLLITVFLSCNLFIAFEDSIALEVISRIETSKKINTDCTNVEVFQLPEFSYQLTEDNYKNVKKFLDCKVEKGDADSKTYLYLGFLYSREGLIEASKKAFENSIFLSRQNKGRGTEALALGFLVLNSEFNYGEYLIEAVDLLLSQDNYTNTHYDYMTLTLSFRLLSLKLSQGSKGEAINLYNKLNFKYKRIANKDLVKYYFILGDLAINSNSMKKEERSKKHVDAYLLAKKLKNEWFHPHLASVYSILNSILASSGNVGFQEAGADELLDVFIFDVSEVESKFPKSYLYVQRDVLSILLKYRIDSKIEYYFDTSYQKFLKENQFYSHEFEALLSLMEFYVNYENYEIFKKYASRAQELLEYANVRDKVNFNIYLSQFAANTNQQEGAAKHALKCVTLIQEEELLQGLLSTIDNKVKYWCFKESFSKLLSIGQKENALVYLDLAKYYAKKAGLNEENELKSIISHMGEHNERR